MKALALALALFCIVEARPQMYEVPSIGGVPYIIGGSAVSIASHPHQVSLQFSSGSHTCGGSIISPTKVACAAHCTQRSARNYRIRAGSADRNSGGQIRSVSRISNHPSYCGSCNGFPNDISVVTVSQSFSYNSNVQPIALASGSTFAGQTCTITGWGRTSSSNSLPTRLQGAQIGVLSHSDCQRHLGSSVRDTMICIYDTASRRGSCNGDSGGPLKCGSVLAGITSWGIQVGGACSTSRPSVYTRVTSYRNWLLSQ